MIYLGVRIDGENDRRWIGRMIGWELIARVARRFRIASIELRDPRSFHEPWSDGAYARMVSQYANFLFFNPDVDLEAAAFYLNRRVGLRLKPSEVYVFAFFHELGHTREAIGPLSAGDRAGQFFLSAGMEEISALRRQSEAAADSWAKVEFRKWRRRKR